MTDLPPTERSARRWTRVLLPISLGFNLVIFGALAGLFVSHVMRGPHEPVRALSFGRFTEALSPQQRQDLRRAFFRQAGDFRAQRQAMRADFGKLIAALQADPYDPARVSALLGQQETRIRHWSALGQKLLEAQIAAMTPKARHAFAARLRADMERRMHRPPPPRP